MRLGPILICALLATVAVGSLVVLKKQREARSHAAALKLCRVHVQEAEKKARAAIQRRAQSYSLFIKARKSGAVSFAEEATSGYSKWRALKAKLPGTDSDGHKQFIREAFSSHLFAEEQVGGVMKQSVDGAVKDIEAIENELAVKIRQEIIGRPLKPTELATAVEEFRKTLNDQIKASNSDAAMGAVQLVGSELAAQIGAQVVVRLATSVGFIGVGASTSWWTFGAGLVIGVAVDVIWTKVTDPAGKVAAQVSSALDEMASKGAIAIQTELEKVLTAKKVQWDVLIAKMETQK